MPGTYVNYIVVIKSITKFGIMRWSNSKVQIRHLEMPIISVKDNENNRWMKKKTKKQNKKQKQKQKAKQTNKGGKDQGWDRI